MPTLTIRQLSFVGGEWSKALYSRTDLENYTTAVRTMKNFVIHPHGGVSNRGGTQYVGAVKDSTKFTRLVPFQFSVVQSYVLEFGDQYMRVLKDGGHVVETAKNITGATKADPVVITAVAHGYATDEHTYISSVGGMTELNGKKYSLTVLTADTFSLQDMNGDDIDGTAYTTYTSGGTSELVYELATPYVEADLELLKFVQSADVLYVTHPTYAPRKISRTDHDAWTISTITFGASVSPPTNLAPADWTASDATYVVTALDSDARESISSNVTACTDGTSLGWTSVAGASYYNVYKDQSASGVFGWVGKANTNTFTVPAGGIVPDFSSTPPQAITQFNGADDYPGVCTFFEQRLLFGRTNNNPQTIWGSVTGDFENMNISPFIKDDDAYEFTINAQQVNEIRSLVPLDVLILGTSGSEWKMESGSQSDSVTPLSVNLKNQSRYGMSDVTPLVIGNSVLFIEGNGAVVRDLTYNYKVDGYVGTSLIIFSKHLFEGYEITDWCYQQEPDSVIWCVRDDGQLIGLTYYRDYEIFGWHQHETDGTFESITSISTAAGVDEVYAIVQRSVNGNVLRYVEKFKNRLPYNASFVKDIADAYFVDCGLTYDGTAATSITGLDHLEGEAVVALADGNVIKDLTVSSGGITLSNAAEKVHVGISYTSDIETLDFVAQSEGATTQDKLADVKSAIVSMADTRALWFGPSSDRLVEVPFREGEDYGDPTEMFDGDKELFLEAGETRESRAFIRNIDPLPLTITALLPRLEYGES